VPGFDGRSRWLKVATGAVSPAEGHPLDAYAARLSRPDAVQEAGPSFRIEVEE